MGPAALAEVAEHRGVDSDLFGDPGGAVAQREPHPQQGVRSRADPPDRPARSAAAAEERLENVTETAEPGEPAAARARRCQRIAAEVDDAPLLGVRQDLVGRADLLEPLALVGVDVGMEFAGQLAVGALDIRIACVPAHSEQPVVVACHA